MKVNRIVKIKIKNRLGNWIEGREEIDNEFRVYLKTLWGPEEVGIWVVSKICLALL